MIGYFNDNKRRIDYILVFDNDGDEEKHTMRKKFLSDLQIEGIEFELAESECSAYQTYNYEDDLIFIKVHAPDYVLRHYAELYDIKLTYRDKRFLPSSDENCFTKIFSTPLASAADQFKKYMEFTSMERSTIVWNIMKHIRFGDVLKNEIGIKRAGDRGLFTSTFPLHESLTIDSDRKLLKKYWANASCWYKYQPLDVIERYFGSEIAIRSAWLGFYTKMLILAAIAGVVCFCTGLIVIYFGVAMKEDLCKSDIVLCPRCNYKKCTFTPLKDSCVNEKLTYVLNNSGAILFAVFMSFWAAVFLKLWERYETTLKWRWCMTAVSLDQEIRSKFEASTPYRRISHVTGEMEPYIPFHIKLMRMFLSVSITTLLIFVVISVMFTITMYRMIIEVTLYNIEIETIKSFNTILASGTAASLNLIFILTMQLLYEKVALKLTTLECPRTEPEFERSYVFKKYIFTFINYYGFLIYTAFFKGQFFTYPGDEHLISSLMNIKNDMCDPTGCGVLLFIQMAIVMIGRQTAIGTWKAIRSSLNIWYYKYQVYKQNAYLHLPVWEKENLLHPLTFRTINSEFEEFIVQYGFVTMFVSAFPLAPLFAVIYNICMIRAQGHELLTGFRRPVSRKIDGLGCWNQIIRVLTYISMVTNPWVITFNTDFVEKELYYTMQPSMEGFYQWRFSSFNVSDYSDKHKEKFAHMLPKYNICYYSAMRYPHDHQYKYQLSDRFWIVLCYKLVFVVLFEHVIFIFTGLLAYAIPDIPKCIKDRMTLEEHFKKAENLKRLKDEYRTNVLGPKFWTKRRTNIRGNIDETADKNPLKEDTQEDALNDSPQEKPKTDNESKPGSRTSEQKRLKDEYRTNVLGPKFWTKRHTNIRGNIDETADKNPQKEDTQEDALNDSAQEKPKTDNESKPESQISEQTAVAPESNSGHVAEISKKPSTSKLEKQNPNLKSNTNESKFLYLKPATDCLPKPSKDNLKRSHPKSDRENQPDRSIRRRFEDRPQENRNTEVPKRNH